jgi:hypothetical protein
MICQTFPQGHILPTSSLQDFWHTCLKLPFRVMTFWGTVLAAVLWSLWKTQNHIIFQHAEIFSITALYFSILFMISYWIGINSTALAGVDRALGATASAAGQSGISPILGRSSVQGAVVSSDEDLLD